MASKSSSAQEYRGPDNNTGVGPRGVRQRRVAGGIAACQCERDIGQVNQNSGGRTWRRAVYSRWPQYIKYAEYGISINARRVWAELSGVARASVYDRSSVIVLGPPQYSGDVRNILGRRRRRTRGMFVRALLCLLNMSGEVFRDGKANGH